MKTSFKNNLVFSVAAIAAVLLLVTIFSSITYAQDRVYRTPPRPIDNRHYYQPINVDVYSDSLARLPNYCNRRPDRCDERNRRYRRDERDLTPVMYLPPNGFNLPEDRDEYYQVVPYGPLPLPARR